ncbi:MAG: class I SAM-dependent methyltransferase [Deltaproteobacteria bacterium]|nr:class I SAM-dependent methyltransferase [Deltaproteobacteria bacterium]
MKSTYSRQTGSHRLIGGGAFTFNIDFDPKKISYGASYDNNQLHSSCFVGHVNELVDHLLIARNIRNSRILEIGCGQGEFLRRLVENPDTGNVGFGFDPSYVGPADDLDGRLHFESSYFTSKNQGIDADAIICRHLIEHIPDPADLLLAIMNALRKSPKAKVFIETPCVEWIFNNNAIWDFFYEHCSYFSASSLTNALAAAGFAVEYISHVFGDQYLWVEAGLGRPSRSLSTRENIKMVKQAKRFGITENRLTERLVTMMTSYKRERDKIAIWGAAAKGVTLVNLVDPNHQLVECLVDINPNKQGCFVPGTGHPIRSFTEMPLLGVKTAFIINPNYYRENFELIKANRIDLKLMNIEMDHEH